MAAPIQLLERERELGTIGRSLDTAVAGDGGVLAIEGEAGAGKTSLLDAAAGMGAEREMLVLRARGGEYERDFPYGVVRQLFETVLDDPGRRAELLDGTAAMAAAIFEPQSSQGAGDPFGSQHGLYWLLVNLADAGPLAMLVDDAQWADLASLQALVYCARRLDGLPIALALTIRTGEPGTPAGLLGELRQGPTARRIVPPPLSTGAAKRLIAASGRRSSSRRFAEACCSATAGNPLLLVELLRGLEEEGSEATEESAERLAERAATGVSGSILARLGRLGKNAVEVAQAVAVLEPNAEVRAVSAFGGLPPDVVADACERLISANLLFDARPLGFVHPLVRAAVLSDMPEPSRAVAHARAARQLAEQGAKGDSVAAHLLLAEPGGDEWAVESLRAAASVALARGVPDAAVRYLRRALREPPAEQTAVMAELGLALLRDFDPEGIDLLRAVRAGSEDPVLRAEMAAVIADSLSLRVGSAEAAPLLEESLSEVGVSASPLSLGLRGRLLQLPVFGLERVPEVALADLQEDAPLDVVQGRLVAQQAAVLIMLGLGPVRRGRELALAATADMAVAIDDAMAGFPPSAAAVALSLADRGERTEDLCGAGIDAAKRRGAVIGRPAVRGIRGLCRYLDGELREAQVDAEIAVRFLGEAGFAPTRVIHVAVAIRAQTARGEPVVAERLADESRTEAEAAFGVPSALFLCARGELRQETGRQVEARDDFLAASARLEWLPLPNPELLGWRSGLARAEAALGNVEEAQVEAARAVELAREAGGQRGIGVALRTQGVVGGGEESIELLREAVEALKGTRARFQHASGLVDLGAALRRANRRREAREPLREGLDLAQRCDANPLEERARIELEATGARPRKAMLSGVESLTPSEHRVARMAAEGMTNREIAQSLFVTAKTVETHLRHVYQKLDISKRTELPGA
jgi:DNA-binding CsgD family transcriptional regulator/tetratricopeptide (TPR) repeat protein